MSKDKEIIKLLQKYIDLQKENPIGFAEWLDEAAYRGKLSAIKELIFHKCFAKYENGLRF